MDNRVFLRHKENGRIFSFNERLAEHPMLVQVNHKEAFPEKYAPAGALDREAQVDISVPEEVIAPPPYVSPELAAQKGPLFRSPASPPRITTSKLKKAPKEI